MKRAAVKITQIILLILVSITVPVSIKAEPVLLGNRYISEDSNRYVSLNSSTKRLSCRFTASLNMTTSSLWVYCGTKSGNASYEIGIQTDSNGVPSGTYLNGSTITSLNANDWTQVNITTVALTKGQIYHIVIRSSDATASVYNNLAYSYPNQKLFPKNQEYDGNAQVLEYNGTWQPANFGEGGMPIFLIDESGTTEFGNPYMYPYYYSVHASGTSGVTTDDSVAGEEIVWAPPATQITGVEFYVRRYGNPGEPLKYRIINVTNSIVLADGILADQTDVSTSYAWKRALFTPVTFETGKTYRIYLYADGISSSLNEYEVLTNSCYPRTETLFLSQTFGGTQNNFIIDSNGGASFTFYDDTDLVYSLVQGDAGCVQGTFGKTTKGYSNPWASDGASLNSTKYKMGVTGTVNTININVAAMSVNTGLRAALYSNNQSLNGGIGGPENLLTQSALYNAALGWNAVPVPEINITPGDYWLAFQAETGVQIDNNYSIGSVSEGYRTGYVFGSFPAVFAATNYDDTQWSIYAQYCEGEAPTPTPTPPVILSNVSSVETLEKVFFTNASYKLSYKFKAPYDIQAQSIRLTGYKGGATSTFVVGIKADDGFGKPLAGYLTSSTPTAAANYWNTFEVPAYTLNAGNIYHIVVEASVLQVGGYQFSYTTPNHKVFPLNQYYDADADVLFFNGTSWASYNGMPLFEIEDTGGKHFGNPYDFNIFTAYIHGNNSASTSDDKIYGEDISNLTADTVINEVVCYLRKAGNPTDPVSYTIKNITDGFDEASGVLANPGDVTAAYQWKTAGFPAVTLIAGKTYRLTFHSQNTGTGSADYYEINMPENYSLVADPIHDGINYQGLNQKAVFSGNGGGTWSIYNEADILFKLQYNPVSTPNAGADWILATGNAQFSGRAGAVLLPHNGKMYLIAGTDAAAKNDVWSSSNGINWTQETNAAFTFPRAYHTGVVYNGKMWVMTGVTGPYDDDVWSSVNGSSWVQETAAAGFPARGSAKALVFDNKMWIIGGRDNSSAFLNDAWYSTNGVDWTAATRNAQFSGRWQHEAVVYNGKMYVIGGNNAATLNDVWSSPDGIVWTQETAAAPFEERRGLCAVAFDDGTGMKMWVYAGLGASFFNDVWYSENGSVWTQKTAAANFSGRFAPAACVFNDSMWAISGNTGTYPNDVWYSGPIVQPTATNLPTFTFTPTYTPTVYACSDMQFFGACSTGLIDVDLNGAYIAASRYQLHEDGFINELSAYIYSSSGGTIRLALYSDSAGAPGSLLFQGAPQACAAGWNSTPLNTQYSLQKGYYWIAVQLSDAGDSMLNYDTTMNVPGYISAFSEGPFPAVFPAGTSNTNGYTVKASYCPQHKWVGHRSAAESSRLSRLDATGKRIAMRFTQPESKIITSVYTYVNAVSASPQYKVGIQAAAGDLPSGIYLTSGFITPAAAGWIACPVTNYTLNPGDYFVVIEPSGNPNGSKYSEWEEGNTPGWRIWPTDNFYDSKFLAFSNLGLGWNPDSTHPIMALKYSDGTVRGNPYHANVALAVHNNSTAGDVSDDRFAMQVFVPGPNGWKVDKIGAFVYASTAAPGGTLDYYIYDEAAKVTITSGVLAGTSNAPVAISGTWVEADLAAQYILEEGKIYKVLFCSHNSPSTNRWHVIAGQTLSGSADMQKATFQGEAGYAGFSTNNNISYTNYLNYDALVRLRYIGPAAAPTFTFTPTPTTTLTNTITITVTVTPINTVDTGWVDADGTARESEKIEINAGVSYTMPRSLAIDNNGYYHAAWRDDTPGNTDIFYKYWNGTAWNIRGNINVSNTVDPSNIPALAVDGTGTPYIAWQEGALPSEIYCYYWNGSAWQGLGGGNVSNNAGNSGYPSIVIDNSGYPVIFWTDDNDGDYDIYMKRWNGTSWGTAVNISNDTVLSQYPSAAFDKNTGNIHVVYESNAGGFMEVHYAFYNGSVWSTPINVSNTPPYDSMKPSIAVDSFGRPHAAWQEDNGTFYQINYLWFNGSAWVDVDGNGVESIAAASYTGECITPSLAVEPSGRPHISFVCNDTGNFEVNYIKRFNMGWVDADGSGLESRNISQNAPHSYSPSLALRADMRPVTVWAQQGSPEDVSLLQYEGPLGTTESGGCIVGLDTAFNNAGATPGIVTHDNAAGGFGSDTAYGIEIKSDSIYAAGVSYNGTNVDMAVWKYNSNGLIDTSFNPGFGYSTHDNAAGGSDADYGRAVALDSGGRVFVAGYSMAAAGNDMALWCYTPGGILDTTFNNSGAIPGIVTHHNAAGGNSADSAYGVVVDNSGKIIVVGNSFNSSWNSDMVIWRYNLDGTLDTSFNSGGAIPGIVVHHNAAGGNSSDQAFAVTIDINNKIVVTGYSYNPDGNADLAIWRYNTNGTLDTSFNPGGVIPGIVTLDGPGIGTDYGYSIVTDGVGNIYVTGMTDVLPDASINYDMIVCKYLNNGSLDNSFNPASPVPGVFTHGSAAGGIGNDYGAGIKLDASGRVVVSGYGTNGTDNDMILWRLTTAGVLDTDFDDDGILISGNAAGGSGNDHGMNLVVGADGSILVAGESRNVSLNNDMTLWKYIDSCAAGGVDTPTDTPTMKPSFTVTQTLTATATATITSTAVEASVIYRSVGPGNTTPLATGSGNNMTIMGSIANFTASLPLNIGVGDAVQYDADNNGMIDSIAFITERINSVSYSVRNSSGGSAANTTAPDQDWAIYRAYTSLANAETGIENSGINSAVRIFDTGNRDMVAFNEEWHFACYDDAVDTLSANFTGWNSGPQNYLRIFTPYLLSDVGASQRHLGKWGTGYRLSGTGQASIYMPVNHVRIEGLQVSFSSMSSTFQGALVIYPSSNTDIRVSHCILWGDPASSYSFNWGLYCYSTFGGNVMVWNNIIYGVNGNPSSSGLAGGVEAGTYVLYNNTVQGCYSGVDNMGSVPAFAKNNISVDNDSDDFYGLFNIASTANISSDSTAPGAGSKTNRTVSFVDLAGKDLHLSALDTEAIDFGVNLSGDILFALNDDIDMKTRAGVWDIGADEYGTGEVQSPTPTITGTATQTSTGTITQTATQTSTETVTQTTTKTSTPSNTATQTVTGTATGTATKTSTGTATQTVTGTITQTATQTSTETVTQTTTKTSTPSNTATQTVTGTATGTITQTSTQTSTETITQTVTQTSTSSVSQTATQTMTETVTHTLTSSVTQTITQTVTPTSTNSVTQTVTQTPTQTITETSTNTPDDTQTITPTVTVTFTNTVTETVSQTSTETSTETATQTVTETVTASATPSATQSITDTSTKTATGTATQTATSTVSQTLTETVTQTSTDSVTVTITETSTATNSVTLTVTFTSTATATESATDTATQTVTETATESVTATATSSATETATRTSTQTATGTPTQTITLSNTPTITITITATPTVTITNTVTTTNTPSVTQTNTETNTPTDTATDTATDTQTPTSSETFTDTATYTYTEIPTETNTFTDTPTETYTSTATDTFTATNTFTETYTPTITPTFTNTATPNTDTALDRNYVEPLKGDKVKVSVKSQAAGELIEVKVYNISGERVRQFNFYSTGTGWNEGFWDCRNDAGKTVGQGLYFMRIKQNSAVQTKRVFIVK